MYVCMYVCMYVYTYVCMHVSFEEQEQWFTYITGDNCDQQIYIQSNPESWWKLVDILNEQFFVNGVFQKTKLNGLEWKEAFTVC